MAIQSTSNLPSIQRIKYEDYKDAPRWFAEFLNTLNLFMTAIYDIINGGINYSNLGVIQPLRFSFTPGSTTGLTLANPLVQVPQVLLVGNVYEGIQPAIHPAVPVQVMWHYSQGKIYVDDVVGLTTGITYTLFVLIG